MVRKRIHNIRTYSYLFSRFIYTQSNVIHSLYTCCFVFPQTGWHIRLSVFPASYMHRDRTKQVVFFYVLFFRSLIAYVLRLHIIFSLKAVSFRIQPTLLDGLEWHQQSYINCMFLNHLVFFLYYSSNLWLYPPAQKTKQNNNQKKKQVWVCCVCWFSFGFIPASVARRHM